MFSIDPVLCPVAGFFPFLPTFMGQTESSKSQRFLLLSAKSREGAEGVAKPHYAYIWMHTALFGSAPASHMCPYSTQLAMRAHAEEEECRVPARRGGRGHSVYSLCIEQVNIKPLFFFREKKECLILL